MQIKSKSDYLKLGERSNVHTTVRKDLYDEFLILSVKLHEPLTKMFDVLLEEILNDKEKLSEYKNKVKLYR